MFQGPNSTLTASRLLYGQVRREAEQESSKAGVLEAEMGTPLLVRGVQPPKTFGAFYASWFQTNLVVMGHIVAKRVE